MTLSDVSILLMIIFLIVLFWHQSRFKTLALRHAYRFAQEHDMQLLDQTIALSSFRLVKDRRYLVAFERVYGFEFTIRGDRRYKGKIKMVGFHLSRIESDAVLESDFSLD